MFRKIIAVIIYINLTLFLNNCEIDAPTAKIVPPGGVRVLTSADENSNGDALPDPIFAMSSTIQTNFSYYTNNVLYKGTGYTTPTTMTNCIAIEFYAYNTEQHFNGYNIYAVVNSGWSTESEARTAILSNLKFYQEARDNSVSTPVLPVEPGDVVSADYATISNSETAFSGSYTKFVVIFNRFYDWVGTSMVNASASTVWICVTAVSLTEDNINESEPSNIVRHF